MKLHYFDQDKADQDDNLLDRVKLMGYVPQTCLLGGMIAMSEVQSCRNPCHGCEGPREKCHGKEKRK